MFAKILNKKLVHSYIKKEKITWQVRYWNVVGSMEVEI